MSTPSAPVIAFSPSNAARLSLTIFRSLETLINTSRSSQDDRAVQFLNETRNVLERLRQLQQMLRFESKEIDFRNPPAHYNLLSQAENKCLDLSDVLLKTIRVARKGLGDSEAVRAVLNNAICNSSRIIKDIIATAYEIGMQQKASGSVLSASGLGHDFTNLYGPKSPRGVSGSFVTQSSRMPLSPKMGRVAEEDEEEPENALKASGAMKATILSEPSLSPKRDPTGDITLSVPFKSVRPQSTRGMGALATRGTLSPRAAIISPNSLQIEGVSATKSPIENAIALFNTKWKLCLQFIVAEGLVEDNTESIARFLFELSDDLSKVQLGEILSGQRDSDTELLRQFTACINFKGDSFVAALRKYLSKFMLPGEAQKISRMMEVFAAEYMRQNADTFPHEDVAFVLAFALIMLNTDAHNPAISDKDKMTKEQFVWNNRGTWVDGGDPPRELLEKLYDEIVSNEIKIKAVGDPDKQGWVKKVEHKEKDGRSWVVLEGAVLKWYKDPKRTESDLRGSVALDYVNVTTDLERDDRFVIASSLPKNLEYSLHKKKIATPASARRLVFLCESPSHIVRISAIRPNVTFEKVPKMDPRKSRAAKKDSVDGKGKAGK